MGYVGGRLQSVSSQQDVLKPRSSYNSSLSPTSARRQVPPEHARTRQLARSRLRSRSHADLLHSRRHENAVAAPDLHRESEDVHSSEDSASQAPCTSWYTAAWDPYAGGDFARVDAPPRYTGERRVTAGSGGAEPRTFDSQSSAGFVPRAHDPHPHRAHQQVLRRQNRQATYPSSASGFNLGVFGGANERFALASRSVGYGTELRHADVDAMSYVGPRPAATSGVGEDNQSAGIMRTSSHPGHLNLSQNSPRSAQVCFPAELANMDPAQDDALTMFLSSVLNEFEPVRGLLVAEDVDLAILTTLSEPQLKV